MEALQPSLRFMLPLCACCRSRLSRNSKTSKSSGPASSRQPAAFDVRHTAASGARSDRQFVGIMVASHSAFTGGAAHGGTRPD